jgi:hypothetical protein
MISMSQLLEVAIDSETIFIEVEPTFGSEETTSADQGLIRTQHAVSRDQKGEVNRSDLPETQAFIASSFQRWNDFICEGF